MFIAHQQRRAPNLLLALAEFYPSAHAFRWDNFGQHLRHSLSLWRVECLFSRRKHSSENQGLERKSDRESARERESEKYREREREIDKDSERVAFSKTHK